VCKRKQKSTFILISSYGEKKLKRMESTSPFFSPETSAVISSWQLADLLNKPVNACVISINH
jgi:hypothetical protein